MQSIAHHCYPGEQQEESLLELDQAPRLRLIQQTLAIVARLVVLEVSEAFHEVVRLQKAAAVMMLAKVCFH